MVGVLGIDAAWTEKEPSGVALLEGSPEGWRCVAVAPSYDSFLSFAEGTPVDWTAKSRGSIPDVGRLLSGAERLLVTQKVSVVTVVDRIGRGVQNCPNFASTPCSPRVAPSG